MEGGIITHKQGKKKSIIIGGGIGRIVLWGGALAAASLVTAFTIKRSGGGRGRPTDKELKLNKYHEGSQGLRLLLQTQSSSLHLNPCCRSNGIPEIGESQIDSFKFVSTQNLFEEEKKSVGVEDIQACDDLAVLFSDHSKTAQLIPSKQDEAVVTEPVEEDYDKEEDDMEYFVDKSNKTSAETVDSSMESNADTIWPTESLEEMNNKLSKSRECSIEEEDTTLPKIDTGSNNNYKHDSGINDNQLATESLKNVMVNDRPAKLRSWIWPVLVLLLLLAMLLSLTHHQAFSCFLLNAISFIST